MPPIWISKNSAHYDGWLEWEKIHPDRKKLIRVYFDGSLVPFDDWVWACTFSRQVSFRDPNSIVTAGIPKRGDVRILLPGMR